MPGPASVKSGTENSRWARERLLLGAPAPGVPVLLRAGLVRGAGVYHAERLWLFLPSSDGLPEVQHPLELALS